jgi:hypothetical protein
MTSLQCGLYEVLATKALEEQLGNLTADANIQKLKFIAA